MLICSIFWCSKRRRGRLENSSARGKYCPVRECGASGRTAVSNLRIREKFHECVRQELSEEKSYRNRAKLLDVIEPELSHFTFELLCFTPVAPVVDQPLQTAKHPPSCSFPASQLDEREKIG